MHGVPETSGIECGRRADGHLTCDCARDVSWGARSDVVLLAFKDLSASSFMSRIEKEMEIVGLVKLKAAGLRGSKRGIQSHMFISVNICRGIARLDSADGVPSLMISGVIFAKVRSHCYLTKPTFNHTEYSMLSPKL